MKVIYKLGVFLLSVLLSVSCHDITTEDITKVTYYVDIDLEGGDQYLLPVGTAYVEPGMTATENGEDVSSKVQISGTVDHTKIGFYDIEYSATNVDGFNKSVTRKVIVYDPSVTVDISGDYAVDANLSHRLQLNNSAVIKYSDMASMYGAGDYSTYVVKIEKIVPGIFSVTDFFGGYYSEGRAYAPAYAYEMAGYISLTPTNQIELCSSSIVAWGNSLNALKNGIYIPLTGTVQWSAEWSSDPTYSFNVVFNKK